MKKSVSILLLHCIVILSSTGQSLTRAFGFEENKGQIRNQHWQPRADVLFSGNAGGLNFYIRKDGISYQIFANNDSVAQYIRSDIHWQGINPDYEIEYGCELDGYNNYYNVPIGSEPALFVRQYESITLKDLWKGVDLIFWYNNLGQLETDWLIKPRADYKQIQFVVKGAEVSISNDGYLIMDTPLGQIREGKLRVYQGEQEVESSWRLQGDTVSFELKNTNPLLAIRIDPPTLLWATYYGGGHTETGYSMKVEDDETIYFAGITQSINQIATVGAFKDSIDGQSDAIFIKFDSSGNRLWGTYYGGDGNDHFISICTYNSDIFVGGITRSETQVATIGAFQEEFGGVTDAFFVKFNSQGIRRMGTYFGGEYDDAFRGCIADSFGNIIISGSSRSGGLATAGSCSQTGEVFIAKFDSSVTQLLWCTRYGGGGAIPNKMQWDKKGNIYITGSTISTSGIASANAHQKEYGGHTTIQFGDAFLGKFDSSGQCVWSTYFGGTHDDGGTGLAVDEDNNVYLIGGSGSEDVIATVGSHQVFLNKIQNNPHIRTADGFVAKFNEDGIRLWGTYFGDTLSEHLRGACFDDSGNIYIVGETNSPKGIATPWAHQTVLKGLRNGLIVKMDTLGQVLWSTYFGGTLNDRIWDCACDNKGSLYITGNTSSETEIATPGAHQEAYGKGGDAFLAKIDARGRYNISVPQIGFGDLFSLYPNPTNSEVILERQNELSNSHITIHDINGRLVYLSNWKQGDEKHIINTSLWQVGVYYVTLQSAEGEKTVRKLMIVR